MYLFGHTGTRWSCRRVCKNKCGGSHKSSSEQGGNRAYLRVNELQHVSLYRPERLANPLAAREVEIFTADQRNREVVPHAVCHGEENPPHLPIMLLRVRAAVHLRLVARIQPTHRSMRIGASRLDIPPPVVGTALGPAPVAVRDVDGGHVCLERADREESLLSPVKCVPDICSDCVVARWIRCGQVSRRRGDSIEHKVRTIMTTDSIRVQRRYEQGASLKGLP